MSGRYPHVAEKRGFWDNLTIASFNVLVFLSIAGLIAFALYLSVLAMPIINAALSLGLLASPWMISFVAALPLIVTLTVLFQFVLGHLELYLSVKKDCLEKNSSVLFLDILKAMLLSLSYIRFLLAAFVFNLYKNFNLKKDDKSWMALALMICCSIALSIGAIMVYLSFGLILSIGSPLGGPLLVSILFGVTLAYYQTLMTPFILIYKWLKRKENTQEEVVVQLVIGLFALGVAIPICYMCFPLLISLLTSLFPSLFPVFIASTAVAISGSFIFLILNLSFQLQRIFTALITGEYSEYGRGLFAPLPADTLTTPQSEPVPVLQPLCLMLCGYASLVGTQLTEQVADEKGPLFHFYQQAIQVDWYTKQAGYSQEFKHETLEAKAAENPSDAFYQTTDALVIAYDVNDQDSFTKALKTLENFRQTSDKHKIRHFMLLGCTSSSSQTPAISTQKLQEAAATNQVFCKEASVQTEQAVKAVFRDFAAHILQNTASYTLYHSTPAR